MKLDCKSILDISKNRNDLRCSLGSIETATLINLNRIYRIFGNSLPVCENLSPVGFCTNLARAVVGAVGTAVIIEKMYLRDFIKDK